MAAVPTPQRIARAVGVRARVLRHRGDAVRCAACGHCFDRWAPDVEGTPDVCWRCGAHARHRAIRLLWRARPQLLGEARALLHFAPEWPLESHLRQIAGLRYVTTDLDAPDVDLHLDITELELPDASFDAVVCSHVLEHIPDDAAAMRELRRITAPGGWCLVMTPLAPYLDATYEDPAVVEPAARRAAFSRPDHVRLYAPDIADRLAAAGFTVERIDPRPAFGAEECAREGIGDHEVIWLCRPR